MNCANNFNSAFGFFLVSGTSQVKLACWVNSQDCPTPGSGRTFFPAGSSGDPFEITLHWTNQQTPKVSNPFPVSHAPHWELYQDALRIKC